MKNKLIRTAIEKQNELLKDTAIEKELLYQALPIVWFGDSSSDKDKILTMGANPSRWEYLDKRLIKKGDFDDRKKVEGAYLPSSKERFIRNSCKVSHADIIKSFDSYFENNPYSGWFGNKPMAKTNKKLPSKAEAFLNGLDASYYKGTPQKYTACHIDLFPFITLRDFKNIQDLFSKELFESGWAKGFLEKLLKVMNPKCVIVLGNTNVLYFKEFIGGQEDMKTDKLVLDNGHKEVKYYTFLFGDYPIIGISSNLGNPTCSCIKDGKRKNVGMTSKDLLEFGSEIKKIVGIE